MNKNLKYQRILSYLGDIQGPGTIRVILPYILIGSYDRHILASYDFVLRADFDYYSTLNSVQFQRSCTEQQYSFIKQIKEKVKPKTNIKILYDIDDLITDIPKYNQAYDYYQINKESIIKILETVDCIVCSTVELSKFFQKYNKTVVLENRLLPWLWSTDTHKINEKTRIVWGGSANHFSKDGSKDDFSKEIKDYINKTSKDIDWYFLGAIPLDLAANKNIKFIKWTSNYFQYVQNLKSVNADIGIALLEDNDFNKCKSNIKALEFCALNIPGIYSKISPYENLKINIQNADQFIEQVELLKNDIDYRNKVVNHDQNKLLNKIFWNDKHIQDYLKIYL